MNQTRAERMAQNFDGIDALVIANASEPFLDSTYWYLTGCTSGTFESARAVVTGDGELHTFVSILEEESAKEGEGIVHVYGTDEERKSAMKEVLNGCRKIGVNYGSAAYGSVVWLKSLLDEDVQILDASKAIADTIAVKDEKEIAAISKACDISSQVASELPDMIAEGRTEREVASEMDIRMLRLGGSGVAFDTIAAFGAYSSQPHHMPCDYALKKGDTALFDFGSKYSMYCSDLTRTIFLGDPGEQLKRAYKVVKEAQIAGLEQIIDGAEAANVDLAARMVIDSSEFKGMFIHSFGHGIGMDIHQPIYVSPKSKNTLKAGNVISAEPGIYIPGVGGIRIEDTVLVTEDGYRLLTHYDHDLTIV